MKSRTLLSLGWIAAIVFVLGSILFGYALEGYSPISQTVSEIGKVGSPFYAAWQMFSVAVGFLLILFAVGIYLFASKNDLSIVASIFIMVYGLAQFFVGVFPSPHTLHNVFGLSMILGYLSPLVFAMLWKNRLGAQFRGVSIGAFIMILLGIVFNLSPIFDPTLYPLQYYGLVQRFLIYCFYFYCAFLSFSMLRWSPDLT